MKVIGLCGGSGSGKGAVASLFAEHGFLHIDADEVYHSLTSRETPCLNELRSEFGDDIITADGSLDRKALAEIVFSGHNTNAIKRLNAISHRHVLREIRRIIKAADEKYSAVLVDAPLLFESGFDTECDLVVAVLAPREERIRRIIVRDNITEEAAARRIDAQISDPELTSRADFVIKNDSDLDNLKSAVYGLISKINI